jgi:hypothetical protein
MSDLGKLSDKQLVNFVGRRICGFLIEIRPYLIEIHTRFMLRKATGKPFLTYTDFEKFCNDFFNYSARHVRRIISGEAMPKLRAPSKAAAKKKVQAPLPETATWTNNDFIQQGATMIKKLLQPLEGNPQRYGKVAAAIAAEIVGEESEAAS